MAEHPNAEALYPPPPDRPVGVGIPANLLVWAILAAVSLGLYANALPNDFMFDDAYIVAGDERVTNMQIARLLTEPYWPGEAFTDRLYRPLISLSYAVNWAISPTPWAFRLPNLLIHVAVCWLVFTLTREIFRSTRAAWIAALLFAIHPIHTEPLNTIVGRADLAVTAFSLAAVLLWWRDAEGGQTLRRPLLAALMLALGLLCKESAVTTLGVMLVLDWYRSRNSRGVPPGWWRGRIVRCYAPALLVIVAYLALRFAVLDTLTNTKVIYRPDNPIATPADWLTPGDSPMLIRWGTPLYTLGKAAGMMFYLTGPVPIPVPNTLGRAEGMMFFYPVPLLHDYSYPAIREIRRLGDWHLWYGLAWLAAIVVACIRSLRRTGAVLVALLAFALAPFSIVSNFVVLIGTIFGERLLYPPSVGVCMAIGLLFAHAPKRRDAETPPSAPGPLAELRSIDRRLLLPLGLWAAWLCLLVVLRNGDWRNVQTLVNSVPDDQHTSFKVLGAFSEQALLRGWEHREAGRLDQERAEYNRALEYGFRGKKAAPDAWGPYKSIARARYRLGEHDKAMAVFATALPLGAGVDLDVLREAGDLYLRYGHYVAAASVLEKRVLREDTPEVRSMFDQALGQCLRIVRDPAAAGIDCQTYGLVGGIFKRIGRLQEVEEIVSIGLARCPAGDPGRADLEALR